ncbi:MAG: hypothetical protein RPU51_06865 [Candidatus Sedimenticola sp. (ex Thyasira tokunagai)]
MDEIMALFTSMNVLKVVLLTTPLGLIQEIADVMETGGLITVLAALAVEVSILYL